MAKIHGGSGVPQGHQSKGTHPRPSPTHGGSGLPKGVTRSPQPQVYGRHGGTALRMGTLAGKRKS
jgi:hypothetical protein